MRRNMGRRGNNNSGGGGGGPLMTGHLQDIDLELELLKRKREMIEQQQQLLVMEQQFKNSSRHSYDQMRYDEPEQHGSNRDFTHLYESGPKHRNQFGRKRQAENQWQYDSAPKRNPPKKKNPSQFNQHGSGTPGSGNFRQKPHQGQGQGSKSSPRPLMDVKVPKQSIGQKIANQKASKTPHKDFTPSKVSKPKAPAAPNKMASHSVAERKSLVAAATESSDGDVSRMLLPDRVPSQQVSGRLELALGAIMKNIRALIDGQPKHATVLRSIQLQRVMKQAVRERIRTVMLGKVVGSLVDILAIYREEFPEETDADILNIALEAGGVSAPDQNLNTKFIESGDPGEFFRANMSSLLEQKLNEMFSKLEDIYGNAPASDVATPEEQIDLQKNAENKDKDDKKPTTEEYKDFLNTTLKVFDVKRILPRLLKRYVPYIVKLLNLDGMYQTTKAAITMKANAKAANIFGTKGLEEGQGDGNTTAPAAQTPSDSRQLYNLPYYVKIMGRPTLPKRKVMQGFLSQFNPKSIKKHRSIHNLLFVGFTEKTDYDVMVGADGAVIGRNTLSVRICTKGGPQESNGENSENNATSNDVSQEEIKKENQNDSDIISSDLDGQITDLLSSIRKSEEEDNSKKENGEKAVEENENNDSEINLEAEKIKMEEGEEGIKNDEEMNENAANEEKDEIVDENVAEENLGDDNTASQEEVTDEVETQNSETAAEPEEQNTEVTDEANTENPDVSSDTEKPEVTETSDDSKKEENLQDSEEQADDKVGELKGNAGDLPASDDSKKEENSQDSEEQADDKVGELKGNAGRSTPSRMSTRLTNVTPSTIRTRRASRLASQN